MATLVAVTTIVCFVVIDVGAVYNPLVIAPTAGDKDHVTAVLELPVMEALNCWDCPPDNETVVGVTATPTLGAGVTVTPFACEIDIPLMDALLTMPVNAMLSGLLLVDTVNDLSRAI